MHSLNKLKPLTLTPVLYLFTSGPMLPKNSSFLLWESISSSAAELDKNIVHSAIEGFVSLSHCLSEVFLAAINVSLIQILFTVKAPNILVMSFNTYKSRKCWKFSPIDTLIRSGIFCWNSVALEFSIRWWVSQVQCRYLTGVILHKVCVTKIRKTVQASQHLHWHRLLQDLLWPRSLSIIANTQCFSGHSHQEAFMLLKVLSWWIL